MNENDRIMYECQTREKNLKEGREEGLKLGREEGKAMGRAEGLAEGRAEGLVEGRAEGLVEGRKEVTLEVASNLKKLGVDLSTIVQVTGLPLGTVEKL